MSVVKVDFKKHALKLKLAEAEKRGDWKEYYRLCAEFLTLEKLRRSNG